MIRHIVWDWNGTLYNDFPAVVAATDRSMRAAGFEGMTKERYQRLYCRPIRVFYERAIGRPPTDQEWQALDDTFHIEYLAAMRDYGLADDATTVLTGWPRDGRTQSLLSMWTHEELIAFVEELDLTGRFNRIDGRRGFSGGPKAASLERHLEALRKDDPKLTPDQVALVGDSVDDADAAEAVGAACVLYTGGFGVAELLTGRGVPVAGTLTEAVSIITRAG